MDEKSLIDQKIEAMRPAFLAKRRDEIPRIQQALSAGDFETIRNIGHNCKGVGNGFGFPEIGLAGAALEHAARARDLVALEQAARQFSAAVAAPVLP
jgi:HPt (histidine-containing phosphotransfer) domain-containing protein